jgi:hypothetical protein
MANLVPSGATVGTVNNEWYFYWSSLLYTIVKKRV